MKKGKLIVIEGIDGSGKGTQLKLLSERFQKQGKKVMVTDFPRYYDSPWGKMAGEFLTGKYGKFTEIDPHFALLPYMLDQYTWSRDIGKPWLEKGGMVILDRYFTSNVHQVAKKSGKVKVAFRKWVWEMGYNSLGLKTPDLVLFLDVPVSITKKLIKNKSDRKYLNGRKKDYAEKNWKHQESSYKEYVYMTKNDKIWKRIKCVTKDNLDLPEEIHKRIWKEVVKVID
jgi:dTMP kinase